MIGRIIKGIAGFYYVHDGETVWECKAKGILRNKNEKPYVGDLCEFEEISGETGTARILSLLPRESSIKRPMVANVGEMLLVFSASVPEPNYEMLNRYLVSIHDYNLPVRMIVTKRDLINDKTEEYIRAQFVNSGIPMHFVSSKTMEGIENLKSAIAGKITTLAGPSGVGKSSLLNALLGHEAMEVGELSRKIDRGKNTTRHSELFFLMKDTYMLDTPGFTSVDFDDVSPVNLALMFDEFVPHLVHCKFSSCKHLKEIGCEVKEAVQRGEIADSRYESYVSMYDYLSHLRRYS